MEHSETKIKLKEMTGGKELETTDGMMTRYGNTPVDTALASHRFQSNLMRATAKHVVEVHLGDIGDFSHESAEIARQIYNFLINIEGSCSANIYMAIDNALGLIVQDNESYAKTETRKN